NENRLGFSSATNAIMNYNDIKADALNELKKLMSPELINRIDDTVVFTPLTVDEVSQILDIQMAEFAERLSQKNIGITLRTKAKSYLIERGYDPSFGARPMRRIIQREIEDPLATKIIAGECKRGDSVIVDYKASKTTDGMLILKIKKETASETGKDKIEIKALIDCEPDIVNTAL
ncbi:MAG: ATP-dependent Clp protease ATP-binding subunit, partial [Spirochaetales bacterium]